MQLRFHRTADFLQPGIDEKAAFSSVYDTLNRGLYPNITSFVKDLRRVFLNCDTSEEKNSIRPAAVSLLMKDFEDALALYEPSSTTLTIKFKYALKDFEKITNVAKPIQMEETAPVPSAKQKPACRFIEKAASKNSDEITCADLKHEISLLRSSKLLLMAIQYIYNLQPEAISLGQGVSIIYTLLTKENISKIHIFIVELLNDAALSQIDGIHTSFLDATEPSIIQQINYSNSVSQKDDSKKKEKGENN